METLPLIWGGWGGRGWLQGPLMLVWRADRVVVGEKFPPIGLEGRGAL